jgi:hypothetical protein
MNCLFKIVRVAEELKKEKVFLKALSGFSWLIQAVRETSEKFLSN